MNIQSTAGHPVTLSKANRVFVFFMGVGIPSFFLFIGITALLYNIGLPIKMFIPVSIAGTLGFAALFSKFLYRKIATMTVSQFADDPSIEPIDKYFSKDYKNCGEGFYDPASPFYKERHRDSYTDVSYLGKY